MNRGRIEEKASCPYCGHEAYHSFYFVSETLQCHNCGKEFAIKVEAVINVKSAKIFDKRCCSCHAPLYNEEIIDGKCPNCKNEEFIDNEFKDSEFEISNRSLYWKNLS